MKKLIVMGVVLIGMITTSWGQTSLEEYNYITKGYKVQIESGLDTKRGYEFENLSIFEDSRTVAELKVLYRTNGEEKEVAAYMIILQRATLHPQYICIPHPDSEKKITERYFYALWDDTSSLPFVSLLLSQNIEW